VTPRCEILGRKVGLKSFWAGLGQGLGVKAGGRPCIRKQHRVAKRQHLQAPPNINVNTASGLSSRRIACSIYKH
jgi:hypothetical protein